MASGHTRTREEIEEIVNNLGYILLEEYMVKNQRTVIILDKFGYKYDVILKNLMNGHVPNFVDFKMPEISLENICLWLKLNEKNFELCVNNEYSGTDGKLWFHCLRKECNEIFDTSWHYIYGNHGCPYCAGKRVSDKNRLSIIRPDIASEWDYNKNIDTPNDVCCSSHKNRFWLCFNGHTSYPAEIANRTSSGSGCPRCAGKIVSDDNRLSIARPDISNEWDYKLNEGTPYDFSYGSHENKYWICPRGHQSYPATINDRTNKGRCCPRCSSSKGEETISKILDYNNIYYVPEKYFENCKNILPLPFDFGIQYEDETWFLIEYHGPQHYEPVDFAGRGIEWAKQQFKENKKRDKIKLKYCKDNNIPLLVIPYWDFDNIESILQEALGM